MSRDSRYTSAPRRHRAAPSCIVCRAATVRRQADIQCRSVDNGYCAERAMIRDYRGENINLFAYRIAS